MTPAQREVACAAYFAIVSSVFNLGRKPDAWKRGKPIPFASDATGLDRFQRYLDRHSPHPADFLILAEPTGSYGLTVKRIQGWNPALHKILP